MKKINGLFLFGVLFSLNSFAYNNGNVRYYGNGAIVKTPDGSSLYIPRQNNKSQKPLGGQGVIFSTTLKVTMEKTLDEDGKPTTVKKYKAWVRHCGEVELQEKKDQNAKTGDRIELRFDRAESCNVMDWKKY